MSFFISVESRDQWTSYSISDVLRYLRSELPFVFDMNKYLFNNAWEKSLAKSMSTRWAKFAAAAVPGDNWPAVVPSSSSGINNYVFELLKTYNTTMFKERECSFWSAHPPALR